LGDISQFGGCAAPLEELARAIEILVFSAKHQRPRQFQSTCELLEDLCCSVEVCARVIVVTSRSMELGPSFECHGLPVGHVGSAGGFESGYEALIGLVELAGGDEGQAAGGVHPHRLDGLVGALEELVDLGGEVKYSLVVVLEQRDARTGTAAFELARFEA
jgi:hypothetical protein